MTDREKLKLLDTLFLSHEKRHLCIAKREILNERE